MSKFDSAIKKIDGNDYKAKFVIHLGIDFDDLSKMEEHHQGNWENETPTHEELTSSIMDEVLSWLNDLRFSVAIEWEEE